MGEAGVRSQESGVRIQEEAEEQVSGARCQGLKNRIQEEPKQDSGFRIRDTG
jgi:hypothetical protein